MEELFHSALEKEWGSFPAKLEAVPASDLSAHVGANAVPADEEGATSYITANSNLLHLVVMDRSAPVSIIQTLLSKCPALASAEDSKGCTPLHISVSCNSPPEIVRLLLQAAPMAAFQRDQEDNNRPIDSFAELIENKEIILKHLGHPPLDKSSKWIWETARLLAIALTNPGGSNQWYWENLPVLHACVLANVRPSSNDVPFFLFMKVLELFEPDQGLLQDQDGNLHIHYVASHSMDQELGNGLLLRGMIKKWGPRGMAKIQNKDGKIPLDLALKSGRGWNTGISQLLEFYPAPDRFSFKEYGLILQKAIREGNQSLVFQMLRHQPQLWKVQTEERESKRTKLS